MNIHRHLRTASHHVTWIIGTRAPKLVPLVFVVGYPKSGTTWAAQLVADYLQMPFPPLLSREIQKATVAAEIVDRYCGDALIEAGYEKDRSWIELCTND